MTKPSRGQHIPCICEIDHSIQISSQEPLGPQWETPCDMVFYHKQDIKKGEKLATKVGKDGFVLAYKLCEFCAFSHRGEQRYREDIDLLLSAM